MPLNIAIIGCGAIAEEHLRALEHVPGLVPRAYCDVDVSRAERLLDVYGGAYATGDAGRLFADDGIDAVYVCTHHDSHAPLAERAAAAGKHIMMEKPLALSIADGERIAGAVAASGVTLMTAFKLRYYPMVERARRFIPEPIISIAQIMDTRWPDDYWAQQPVVGGGNVISQGSHAVDLLCYLNGSDPVSVFAEGGAITHRGAEVIDTIVATIRFANGRIASWAQSDGGLTPYVSKFSFQLADGVRTVHLHNRLKSGVFHDGTTTETIEDESEEGMIAENVEFHRALSTGTPPASGVRDGLRATTVVLKAFEAIRTGEVQGIDLGS